jgi:hypothetical protein
MFQQLVGLPCGGAGITSWNCASVNPAPELSQDDGDEDRHFARL